MDQNNSLNRQKVAILSICLNPEYWPYLGMMIESAKKFFLRGHQVEFLCWSDIPDDEEGLKTLPQKVTQSWQKAGVNLANPIFARSLSEGIQSALNLKTTKEVKIFPTAPQPWPAPTLFRYSLFLQQEELLKEYDYLYYCDADMEFVSRVGEEIFGEMVMAEHPMYAVNLKFIPPYEPNRKSHSYISRPGQVIEKDGKKRFKPLYAAGGFQGGRSDTFIKAMKGMKELIRKDFDKGYVPIWNDETTWNYWLFKNPPDVILSPSYVYPDSLNKAYYQKIWGRNYCPKIITITKPFSLVRGLNLQNILPK